VQRDRLTRPTAVVCDVGDTLLREVRFDLEAGIRAALPSRMRDAAASLAHAFRDETREAHASHRELMLASWLRRRVSQLRDVEEEQVEDAIWREVLTLVPTEGVAVLLRRLRGDGVRIGALSNAYFSTRVLHRELERHGLTDSIEIVLSSGDLGIRKPDARIYFEMLARLGVTAGSTWYVGDTFEEDIVGATNAGLVPIWLHRGPASRDVVLPIRQVEDWTDFASLYGSSSLDA
jgi:HAD superfamily hydrolase (TIGR01549 family)